MSNSKSIRFLYLGVFTISMAALTLEIGLTRIFSVSLWYHLAFMVISTALLGYGASGAYLTVRRQSGKDNPERDLVLFAGLTAISMVISFAIMTRVPLDPLAPVLPGLDDAQRGWETAKLILLLLVDYILVVVPFFFAGLTLGGALSSVAKRITTLYFADLVGGGLGCLLVVGALWVLPGQGVVLLAAGLAALSTLFFSLRARGRAGEESATGESTAPATPSSRRGRLVPVLAVVGAVLLFALSPIADKFLPLYIPPSKPLYQANDPSIDLVYTGYTPFARVDVLYQKGASLGAWGLSSECSAPPSPEQMFITIDAAAITAITHFNGDLDSIGFVNCAPSSLAYRVRTQPLNSALIIGPGGGIDVLTALYNGVKHIVGAEINPRIVDLVADDALFKDYAGGLYTDYPNIQVQLAEGRNFVSRSKEKFDLIQFSQVDTWAAASSGAYSLSENFLYTTEAFLDYYDHLTDDGLLTVGRWYFDPPQQAFRLVTIGTTALEQRGVGDPSKHFIVVRAGDTSTFIMKKTPFTGEEINHMYQVVEGLGFTMLYAPDMKDSDNWFVRFFTAPDRAEFYRKYPLDVTPTSDDRPFFFEYYGWSNLGDFRSGKATLVILLAEAIALAAAFILWPLWRFSRRGLTTRGARRFLIYFAALGVGFILIEIGLMQRFILFLGQPTYSTSVVLFSILAFSGIGSFWSGRLLGDGDPRRVQRRVIPLLAVLAVIYIFLLPPLFRNFISLELSWRVIISIVFLAPLGLLMGMPFPMGIRLVDNVNPSLVPWAWGVNGFGSVIGSILAVMIAQSYGFSIAIALAVVVYLLGLGAALSLGRLGDPSAEAGAAG